MATPTNPTAARLAAARIELAEYNDALTDANDDAEEACFRAAIAELTAEIEMCEWRLSRANSFVARPGHSYKVTDENGGPVVEALLYGDHTRRGVAMKAGWYLYDTAERIESEAAARAIVVQAAATRALLSALAA